MHHIVRLIAQNFDIAASPGFYFRHFRTVTDHHQFLIRHLTECFNNQVDTLIRHHAGGGKIEVFFILLQSKTFYIDRRINNIRIPAIDLLNSPGNKLGISDKVIHAIGCPVIPNPDFMQEPAGQFPFQAFVQPRLTQILVLKIPGIADRRMHITDVQLIRAGQYAFSHRMTAGKHNVMPRHIKLLDSQRH
ncbi:hypothetical protein SRABI106_01248 [Rahnella aquatilis]|nr:hypothetical protein SRABI106_01248 [Rahnella aquatilis]